MDSRVPQDYIDSLIMFIQCIDSINKYIMIDSVDMINQASNIRCLLETYNKVIGYVFQIISGNSIILQEIFL